LRLNIPYQIITLNGVLILWNMIPWGIFDGGRFAKLFFNSISEERDQVWVFRLVSIIGIGFLLIFMSTGQLPMMAMLLVGWGLHFQANHDDPRGSHSKLAMSASAQRNWAGVYVSLVLISLLISVTTPNWCHNRPYPATNTMAAENHR
jgi:hypothetical protein